VIQIGGLKMQKEKVQPKCPHPLEKRRFVPNSYSEGRISYSEQYKCEQCGEVITTWGSILSGRF
jgi:hypothetical protein